jgi:ABC-type multidrug transport system ATPase subunit
MIQIEDLQKVIDGQTVVDISSLNLNSGRIAGIIGPVGSKKRVVFELLIGQERPTAGSVRILGNDHFKERNEFSRRVGVLFPENNLYLHQSARSNLNFYRRLYRLPSERVEEVLVEVGLVDHADTKVEQLPSNLVRRLAVGRALLHHPDALLLDEPIVARGK